MKSKQIQIVRKFSLDTHLKLLFSVKGWHENFFELECYIHEKILEDLVGTLVKPAMVFS